MIKEGFGVAGKDVSIGSDILVRVALADDFAKVFGRFFDNDSGRCAPAHPDALNFSKSGTLIAKLAEVAQKL